MKVKGKLWEALGSLKDYYTNNRAMISNQKILSDIEAAIIRCTSHHDVPIDEKYVHEILFIVSNAPGSITFLARRMSTKIETTRDPVVALKTLVLLHRLLRGGDRYFEQDLRNLWYSRDLRLDLSWCAGAPDGSHTFLLDYSLFLEERLGWIINQAGMLEPIRPSRSNFQSYEEEADELVLHRLLKGQLFLDRVMACLRVHNSRMNCTTQSALNIILRESFRVYESFCEGVETVLSSFFDLKKSMRVLALDILKKACSQTPQLHEFYDNCKRSIVGKNLDYPFVRIITAAQISSMEEFLPTEHNKTASVASEDTKLTRRIREGESMVQEAKVEEMNEASSTLFSKKLETKISTVWVEFDEEDSQTSTFFLPGLDDRLAGVADDLLTEGESSTTGQAMHLL
ncbi:putative clathrin assembly protein At1g33340 [Phoenix dactylifera]|uniref:Clathrin assembly protein At1g33340 n=1 Tax=Phoenix dactylifera TaxID=42345 RepID=A0A8B7CY76_PHODC|nr:putative clathrin assembly protein At1g33340 [Phoenix dactylifera]